MNDGQENNPRAELVNGLIETAIKISLLAIVILWCFQIIKPFISLVLWGGIISIALYPFFLYVENKVKKNSVLSAVIVSSILLLVIVLPMTFISTSMIDSGALLADSYKKGEINIPPPSESVAEWPLVGQQVYDAWKMINENTSQAAEHFKPQIRAAGKWLIVASANTGLTLLLFIASIILAGVFMVKAIPIKTMMKKLAGRLVDEKGGYIIELSVATIRSVAQGVIGIAIIQALLAALGFIVMDVPAAGIWVFAVLVLAIVQLPPILVLGPVILYVYSVAEPVSATIFAGYMLIVGFSDTLLKPLLLGRGLDVPMLVILLGAIGGMVSSGIIGLFTGAVVLALGYTLLQAWINDELSEAAKETVGQQ